LDLSACCVAVIRHDLPQAAHDDWMKFVMQNGRYLRGSSLHRETGHVAPSSYMCLRDNGGMLSRLQPIPDPAAVPGAPSGAESCAFAFLNFRVGG
jgi:hypothetical protein